MEWDINTNHTLYAVFLTLPEDHTIEVGAKGALYFTKGNYVYIGSAKKHIEKRVNRHYQIEKTKRWHIDYLRPYCAVTKIKTYDHPEGECSLAAHFAQSGEV